MSKIVEKFVDFPTVVKRPLWQFWHNVILKYDKASEIVFMNYGYQNLNGDPILDLKKEDEVNRYCIQLYDYVVKDAELEGKDVLEVGSGRGGGASYISRYFKPKSYTALDISESVIKFCNNYHQVEGLSFVKGFAEKQPFENNKFDFVVNVESARCYGSLDKFFTEVNRVLRSQGQFLFADMIRKGEVNEINEKLEKNGFEILRTKNITKNIVEALDRDNERREHKIKSLVPKFLSSNFLQFAGTKNTERYNSFSTGKMEYWTYILKKKE